MEWLSNFILSKVLLGDSQVCLYWIKNRNKRTTSFIRNRVHLINRVFEDDEVFFIRTEHNPSDLGTKFNNFENSYKKMTDESPFRAGPAFMKSGLEQAKANGDVINISDLKIDGPSTSVANAQLTEFNQSEPRSNDALTSTELATDQDQDQFSAATDQEHATSEEILLCSESSHLVQGDQEIPLQQKISERLRFSNYLVCPIRLSYRKMVDTTALTLFASFKWLSQHPSKTKMGSRRQKLCTNLTQEPATSTT